MVKVEIACFNALSATVAQDCAADRVELCAAIELGGTTPAVSLIKMVREQINIDLNIMIRPRGGNFVYTDAEFLQMKQEVQIIKQLGVDGLVFGILHPDNTINVLQNKELVDLAYPLPCTFHRAFDSVPEKKEALEDIINCGFKTILTSGCTSHVMEGLEMLKQLVGWSAARIVIMPGGGLRAANVGEVLRETGASYVHSSAITDGSDTAVANEVRALKANV